jgi:hypothetical protein
MSRDEVEDFILKQAQVFSANQQAGLDDYVYKDLGIGGGDAVEFYQSIEKRFAIDIRPITESAVELEAAWFRKARRKSVARDLTLKEIATFIEAQTNYGQLR